MISLLTLLGCAGERPATLGAQNGQLGTCPDSPNCVSSNDVRESHNITPLSATLSAVREAVRQMPGAQIIREDGNYLYAEFTTRLMGFVDDVEFLADPAAGVVHVRSASRLGKSDLGVNRKRIEAIRLAVQ
ncbi:MAG: DUF1499 domain-containing protein [Gammaproteobacteria bacterium]|nr:DUF1499 domain-containing protein [Gammaproteobacteria bacterium]MDP2141589.1 DUF1499 domain-containing protein [Gammaproteobacteria bacterium]MDP2346656.1 DUF1499 domain-containing protein [Gammaproteobacteria bacterium]